MPVPTLHAKIKGVIKAHILRAQASCCRDQNQGPLPCKHWCIISHTEPRTYISPLCQLRTAPYRNRVLTGWLREGTFGVRCGGWSQRSVVSFHLSSYTEQSREQAEVRLFVQPLSLTLGFHPAH